MGENDTQLYLVRCARAESQSAWAGAGGARPLTNEGRAQAAGLVDLLGEASPRALLSGPSLRCRQTLEPLAGHLALPIQIDDRLDRDQAPEAIAKHAQSLAGTGSVVCLHRRGLLETLRRALGSDAGRELEDRCEKGSVWVLEGDPPRATYYSPRRSGLNAGPRVTALEALPLPRADHPTRTAVLDLGSTSFHLLVAEMDETGEIRRIARERTMLRMGGELARHPEIRPSFIEKAVAVAREMRAAALEHKAGELIAVGTASLREAANGEDVARRLEEVLETPIHVLSGEEEAHIIFRAIRARIQLGKEPAVGMDLGGGSLEIAVGDRKGVRFESTLPIGVARMQAELDPGDPLRKSDLRELRVRVHDRLAPVVASIQAHGPRRCIAVGGTARGIARLLSGDRSSPRGLFVSRVEIARLSEKLAGSRHHERIAMPGMSQRRVDLMPLGAEILGCALNELGMEGLTICDWGLREGIILELREPRDLGKS